MSAHHPASERPPDTSAPPPGWPDPEPAAAPGGSFETRSHRPRLLLVGVALLAVLATALILTLDGGSSGRNAFAPIAEAAERTANFPGARFAGAGHTSTPQFDMTMSFTGEYNGASDRSTMRMETEAPGLPAAAEAMNPMIGVQDGLTIYMSAPAFAAGLPDGKSWMKIDYSEFAEGQPSATDARGMLEQLRAVGEARKLGRERVRGTSTIHYAATLDPELQAEQARDMGDELSAEVIETQGGTTAVDVWVDDRDLIRRLAMTVPFDLVAGEGAEMRMTVDYFDFGIEPQIDLPPEDDVFDATKLGRSLLESTLDAA